MRIMLTAFTIVCTWSFPCFSEDKDQPYAGLDRREIASLSAEDIAELEAGRGWGLALPAELNGFPGPTHVLDLADALDLSENQRIQMNDIFEEMQQEAIAAGSTFIAAERALDQAFANGDVTEAMLQELTKDAADAMGRLRFIHLSRHLQTIGVLNDEQVARYAVLRGYSADPCSSVPPGHDEDMWRRHNGCENQ